MAEPTIEEIFGSYATQDASNIHLSKRNLADYGLTRQDVQSPEGIFAAIFLQAANSLNTNNQSQNPDISIAIDKNFNSLVERSDRNYREFSYTVKFHVLDEGTEMSADSF